MAHPNDLQETRARMDEVMGALPLAEGVQAEPVDADGVTCILCRRAAWPDDPSLLYFHGGGYRLGSALAYRSFGAHLAKACRVQVFLVDYPLAPEHPYPGAVIAAARAYGWLVRNLEPGRRFFVGGDSAGGGLAAAVLVDAKAKGIPMARGGILLSPWLDLTNRADSYQSRAGSDALFSKTSADTAAGLYLGETDPTEPLASPLFADWRDMPALQIQVSDAEVLLDDATALAEVIETAGGHVELHIVAGMPHVWPIQYPALPEAVDAVNRAADFVSRLNS